MRMSIYGSHKQILTVSRRVARLLLAYMPRSVARVIVDYVTGFEAYDAFIRRITGLLPPVQLWQTPYCDKWCQPVALGRQLLCAHVEPKWFKTSHWLMILRPTSHPSQHGAIEIQVRHKQLPNGYELIQIAPTALWDFVTGTYIKELSDAFSTLDSRQPLAKRGIRPEKIFRERLLEYIACCRHANKI